MPARPRTITETFDHVLEVDPHRGALVAPSQTMTYAELDEAANKAASILNRMGVLPGDRVAACLPNDIDIVVAFHGAMRLGAIWVGVNRALAEPEKQALLAAAEPAVFIADPGTAEEHAKHWRCVRADPADPESEWQVALRSAAGASRPPSPDPELPAGIAFTSGTTGSPKGIVHSQRNLLLPAAALVASRGYDETLRKGDCLPLTILNLQVLTTLLTSAAGGCCILTDRRDAKGVAQWLARESVNVWNAVPALLYSMVHDAEIDPSMLSGMREIWTGGAACPEDLFQSFQTRFGIPLRQSYGLTEAPTVVTIDPVDRDHVADSSGKSLPHLEIVIRDDDGKELAAREPGEITVRGVAHGPWAGAYSTMLGFWRAGSVEEFGRQELMTGDLGTLDEEGNLFVRDRKKLLIIRGGANVYPAEVERVIEQVPGVRAGAVLGVPDPRLGQRVVAVVEVEPGSPVTAEGVIDACHRELARYKVPEEIVVVDSLPRNAMGKIQRGPLSELFTART